VDNIVSTCTISVELLAGCPQEDCINGTLLEAGRVYVGWLIATIVLIALVCFMIVSPGFRVFIIGFVVLGAIAIFGWIKHEEKEKLTRTTGRRYARPGCAKCDYSQ
jgi:hypothetical protein